jgi:hypothetical protein
MKLMMLTVGRNAKKIKNQRAKIKNVEPLCGAIFD